MPSAQTDYSRLVVTRSGLQAAVVVLLVLALTVLAGETIHELHYVDAHPDAYGPAKVIALACGAGAVIAFAAGIAVLTVMPERALPRWLFLSMIVATIALGVWLVTLSAQAAAPTNSGFGVSPSDLGISNSDLGIP